MFGHKDKKQSIRSLEQEGFSILLSVILIGAISVSIAVAILTLGVDASNTSFANQQANQAKALANACAEEALQQIRDNDTVTGYGGLTFSQGNCGYFITDNGGENRNIFVSSTVGTIVRKIDVDIDNIDPQINISSWQEVAN